MIYLTIYLAILITVGKTKQIKTWQCRHRDRDEFDWLLSDFRLRPEVILFRQSHVVDRAARRELREDEGRRLRARHRLRRRHQVQTFPEFSGCNKILRTVKVFVAIKRAKISKRR